MYSFAAVRALSVGHLGTSVASVRCPGQSAITAKTDDTGTGPAHRESFDRARLSPMTKTESAGTVPAANRGCPQWFGFGGSSIDASSATEPLVLKTDPAGTATRPLRVQAGHPHLLEPVDHLPHRVLVGLDQTGDHRHAVPAGRGQRDRRPPQPDRRAGPTTHESLELLTLLIT